MSTNSKITDGFIFGSGSDSITLLCSEDAYLGDAQFTITVDGQQIGGVQTVTASHADGDVERFTLMGNFSGGPHSVAVTFLNDAYAGTPETDRNLYVDAIAQDGVQIAGGALYSDGTLQLSTQAPEIIVDDTDSLNAAIDQMAAVLAGDVVIKLGGDITETVTLAVNLHEGVSLTIDSQGHTLRGSSGLALAGLGTLVLSGSNSYAGGTTISGGTLELAAASAAGSGPIGFIGSAPATLWLDPAALPDGTYFSNPVFGFGPTDILDIAGPRDATPVSATLSGSLLTINEYPGPPILMSFGGVPDGTAFQNTHDDSGGVMFSEVAPPVTIGSGSDSFILDMSEDPYLGNAQFTVSVDGQQIGGVQTAQAYPAYRQAFTVNGDFPLGDHIVTVTFLNDAYGGAPTADRNLYVQYIFRYGQALYTHTALYNDGSVSFHLGDVPAPHGDVVFGSGPDAITLQMSEDLFGEDARFQVSVDGQLIDFVFTSTAGHAIGRTQSFTIRGDFGAGPHDVGVNFVNDAYVAGFGGGDRNLYVDSIATGGLVTQIDAAFYNAGERHFTVLPPVATLTGSDVTGPASGHAVLNGTAGDDLLIAQGGGNTINGLGGNDTIAGGEAGGDTIIVGRIGDELTALKDDIGISGVGNVIMAGEETLRVSGSASDSTLRLGNGSSTVTLDGTNNTVFAGLGANVLSLTGGGARVMIGPPDPAGMGHAAPFAYDDTITLSGQSNTVSASFLAGRQLIAGQVQIFGGDGYGSFTLGAGPSTVHTDGRYNTISFAGTGDIVAGSGYDTVNASGFGTIRLAGEHNSVSISVGKASVTGGDGNGTFRVSGIADIITDGPGNNFEVRGGQATIDAGSGSDTVSLFGSQTSLIFRGAGDMMFVHPLSSPGVTGPNIVSDQSTDLQVYIDQVTASIDFTAFGAASVVHLLDSTAYSSAADAFNALVPDSAGGSILRYDGGEIHFAPGIVLSVENFKIG